MTHLKVTKVELKGVDVSFVQEGDTLYLELNKKQ